MSCDMISISYHMIWHNIIFYDTIWSLNHIISYHMQLLCSSTVFSFYVWIIPISISFFTSLNFSFHYFISIFSLISLISLFSKLFFNLLRNDFSSLYLLYFLCLRCLLYHIYQNLLFCILYLLLHFLNIFIIFYIKVIIFMLNFQLFLSIFFWVDWPLWQWLSVFTLIFLHVSIYKRNCYVFFGIYHPMYFIYFETSFLAFFSFFIFFISSLLFFWYFLKNVTFTVLKSSIMRLRLNWIHFGFFLWNSFLLSFFIKIRIGWNLPRMCPQRNWRYRFLGISLSMLYLITLYYVILN